MSTAAMASVVIPPPASRSWCRIRSQAAPGAAGPPTAAGPLSAVTIAWMACAPARTVQLKPWPAWPSLVRTVAAVRNWLVAPGPHGWGMGSS
jgi:hypothetical protein